MSARWRRYNDEELEFLRGGYKRMSLTNLVVAFNEQFDRNRTDQQIKSTLANYGFKSGRGKKITPYTKKQIEFLKENYPNMTAKKLTQAFNTRFQPQRSQASINHILARFCQRKHGRKPGEKSSYTKEQITFLRDNYKTMTTPELIVAFNAEFKTNKKYWAIVNIIKSYGIRKYRRRVLRVGDETLCHATGYTTVKTEAPAHNMKTKRNYRYKHLVVWEKANGPVPHGHYVRFIDGNKQNCDPSNLLLVSIVEHGVMNMMKLKELQPEVRQSAIAVGRLHAKCIELERANS
jgi:hypothetical protein